jgi:transcriptional regulator with XRE-family HTH domain
MKVRVAYNLRRLRAKRELSQGELAVKAGTERTYVSRLEQGRKNPTVELLAALAEALNADIVELFKPAPKRAKERKRARASVKTGGAGKVADRTARGSNTARRLLRKPLRRP